MLVVPHSICIKLSGLPCPFPWHLHLNLHNSRLVGVCSKGMPYSGCSRNPGKAAFHACVNTRRAGGANPGNDVFDDTLEILVENNQYSDSVQVIYMDKRADLKYHCKSLQDKNQ